MDDAIKETDSNQVEFRISIRTSNMSKALIRSLCIISGITLLNAAVFEHVPLEFFDDDDPTYHLTPVDIVVEGNAYIFKFGYERSRK